MNTYLVSVSIAFDVDAATPDEARQRIANLLYPLELKHNGHIEEITVEGEGEEDVAED